MTKIELKQDQKRNYFLAYILQSLSMPTDEFLSAITDPNCCYERTIHKWIIKLFDKGKSKENALQIIFKARILYFIRTTKVSPKQPQTASKNLIELLQMLDSNANYKKLNEDEKLLVQQKIDDLIGVASSKEIIEQVLEKMNPMLEIEKETRTVKIFTNTLNRIRKAILQLNLKNYKNK